jgi:hypothetical protein
MFDTAAGVRTVTPSNNNLAEKPETIEKNGARM